MRRAVGRGIAAFLWVLGPVCAAGPGFAQGVKTLGPAGCGIGNANCHANENNWWKNDKHSRSSKPFENLDRDYADLARRYGIDPTDDASVNQKCMTCHGTVITGLEKKTVGDGVSCESCHGPGSGYLDPHQNPDYQKGIAAGLRDLRQGPPRAKVCVDCHFTVDPKLVRSGHPAGWSSAGKYVREMKSVSGHWGFRTKGRAYETSPVDTDESPFAAAIQAKGPPVVLEAMTPAAPPPAAATPDAGASAAPAMPPAATAMPGGMVSLNSSPPEMLQVIVLEPFPIPPDSASVNDILSTLKSRLDRVYSGIQSAYGSFR